MSSVQLWNDERGSTATEYALIAAMVAFVVLVGIIHFATAVSDLWLGVADTLTAAMP